MPVEARATTASDVAEIDAMCLDLCQKQAGAAVLLETALICITAVDTDKGAIVGFLCLDDVPCVRLGASPAAQEWLSSTSTAKSTATDTAFVWVTAIMPDYEVVASHALMRAALLTAHSLKNIFMVSNNDITFQEPGLAALFNCINFSKECSGYLYECNRSSVLPPLSIRIARVEDHDDMLPVLERADAKFPALAKLPETSRPEEAFALTRVVSGQDDKNFVFVAQAGDKLVGFMVVTSEVETSCLLDAFDLHPYDNFLPMEVYEEQYAAAKSSVYAKKMNILRSQQARQRSRDAQQEAPEGATAEGGEEIATRPSASAELATRDSQVAEGQQQGVGDDGAAAAGAAAGAGAGAADADADASSETPLDLEAAAQPTEEEIRNELATLTACQPLDVEPTIFAITMLCIDEEYEAQAVEFLQHAFEAFPEREYCVVTLPHDSPEPPLIGTLTRVAPLPGSLFPEVLYIFNRNALIEDFGVRLSAAGDAEGVSMLISGMPNSSEIQELFNAAHERGTAVVATCGGEVVGLCTISPTVDLDMLRANFALDKLVDLAHHPPQRHAEIDMYCMNPIFAHRHREFLAGAQRLLHCSCLHYALAPGQPPPEMLDELLQVPPRHRSVPAEQQAQFALYAFCRKAAFARRRGVNAQIVVVGASECGLATIERLLLDPQLSFRYLTLLAPSGISVGGVACQYTAAVIARMGLEARVTVLDAEMVGLERGSRLITLADGTELAYDLLLVTMGLQEQTRNEYSETDPEVAANIVSALELSADFSIGDAGFMNNIIVYGDSLSSYHALSVLENRGAASKTRFRSPLGEQSPLVSVLREAAAKEQLMLPEPEAMRLTSLTSVSGDVRPRAVFEGTDSTTGEEVAEDSIADLVVGCRPPDASKIMFQCFNNSGIVYDGRVVVDAAFRTSDLQIYAAGSIAKLSRRFGSQVHFEHYNSKEVGGKLAESVVSLFLGTQRPEVLPVLQAPKVVGCNTPGGMTFLYAGRPHAMASPSLQPPAGGRSLCTSSDRGYLHINVDADGWIHSMIYMGRPSTQIMRFTSIVGLHLSYLNDVAAKLEQKEVTDLTSFLAEPWAEVLYHDDFQALRSSLLTTLQEYAATTPPHGYNELLGAEIQHQLLQFVQSRAADLSLHAATLAVPVS